MSYQDITFEKEAVFLVTGGAGFIGSNLCEAFMFNVPRILISS